MPDPNKNCSPEDLRTEIAILKEKISSADKNLIHQAQEYERRLAALNHEAAKLADMQATYVPREVYESNYRDLMYKIEAIQKLVYIGVGGVLMLQIALKFLA